MRAFTVLVAAAALAGFFSQPARSAVTDSQASGFTVKEEVEIAAPPAKIWDALTAIGAWWDSEHTFSGSAKNLSLDLKTGGCWCETLAGGGGVTHLTFIYVQPGVAARAVGALGPLQAFGAAGAMTWTLKPVNGHTLFTLTYDVGGHAPGGLDKLAAPVDTVLGAQVARLKAYAETGKP